MSFVYTRIKDLTRKAWDSTHGARFRRAAAFVEERRKATGLSAEQAAAWSALLAAEKDSMEPGALFDALRASFGNR
jgi:hypothetical protein